jgi:hypothetical protein
MRWEGYAARMGDRRGVYMVLVGKSEGKREEPEAKNVCTVLHTVSDDQVKEDELWWGE